LATENVEAIRLKCWLIDLAPPSQAELARRAGVSKQTISKVLRGILAPSPEVLRAAEELGLPPHRPLNEAGLHTDDRADHPRGENGAS
jgi:transcriptional regulator with XRE-family HTH domain